ncbi:virulence factor TspB C-terminal domain-related protein [Paraburkholderia agricolaris]|uniref:virulence factor TspB C-terminal domain-related protein n=1 Tax=Paraburkholderia agricolaris TaxID=2152888 RepID=UPI001C2BF5E6|nr:virulence factor TspB C-terminal domain-related protein [Paraburkholderia agricolaris]
MSFVGKAANDASYASMAAGTVATIFGAPVWLSALVSVGALAAAGAVAWGIYNLTQTGSSSNPSLTLTPQNPSTTPPPQPAPQGSWTSYTNPFCNPAVTTTCGNNPLPATIPYYMNGYPNSGAVFGCASGLDCAQQTAAAELNFNQPGIKGTISVSIAQQCSTCTAEPLAYTVQLTWPAQPNNPTVTGASYPVWPSTNPAYVAPPTTQTGSLQSLSPTANMLTQPFPQTMTAALADQLWKNAASQPGYDGYPYDATNPVSQSDVATAPVSPTWNDVVEAMPRPTGSTSVPISTNPIPNSPYTPGQTTPVNPSSGTTGTTPTTQDPCQLEPNASACAPLGTAPAAPPIPTSSANVSMSPWAVGAPDGVCPAPQVVTVLGSPLSLSWDPVCQFVQKVRPLILAICALAAALIVAMGVSL